MAKTFSFTIQDDIKADRDRDAFCAFHGYQDTILDTVNGGFIPNTQTKKNFVEAKLESLFKDQAKNQRRQDAFNNLIIEE